MSARDDYPLLAAHARFQHNTGKQAAAALDEIDRLRARTAQEAAVIEAAKAWHACRATPFGAGSYLAELYADACADLYAAVGVLVSQEQAET